MIVRGADEARAQPPGGEVVTGHLDGTTPATLAFVTAENGRRIPLTSIHQILCRPQPRLVRGMMPPRRIVLRGGESLHAEFVSMEEGEISISPFGDEARPVPRAALAALLQPAGLRLVAYEDFESRPTLFDRARLDATRARSGRQSLVRRPGDDVASCVLARPLTAGRVDLDFYDTGATGQGDEWFVEFEFGAAPDMSTLRFIPGWSDAEYRCTGNRKLARQRLTRSVGWHRLALLLDAHQVVVFVDEQVLATGPAGTDLTAIRCGLSPAPPNERRTREEKAEPANGASAAGWIDDLKVFQRSEEQPVPRNGQPADLAWLAGGDELFGEVLAVDQRSVLLGGKFGRRPFAWSELRGIVFAPGRGPSAQAIEGLIATIDLAPILGADGVANDQFVVALQAASEEELRARHPYLGALRIPAREINRIVPQFQGSLVVVDPAHHHLGDAIREDFHTPLAEGTELEWKPRIDAVPQGRGFVSLLAADLEPRGSRTNREGADRKGANREGLPRQPSVPRGLETELLINGRRIADLNRFVSLRSLPANPQRLRIPFPAGLLKRGENIIRFEQRPARDNSQEYDDCEISRLALEFEP
jgi:hypothetical protein